MSTLWVVSIIAVCILGTLCAILFNRAWKLTLDNESLEYRLQCWRNCFSSKDPNKALFWLSELQKLGEIKNV